MTRCSVDECETPVWGHGWCQTHYRRWYRTGDPNGVRRRVGRTETERFWEYVEKTSSCWLWTGAKSHGYGNFHVSNGDGTSRQVQAHRWAYEHLIGPVSEELVLDHLCRVRHCVRPQHLQPVRQQINVLRGEVPRALRENACIHGHAYTPDNTFINSVGARVCRTCKKANEAAARARHRDPDTPPNPVEVNRQKTHCKRGHPFDEANTYVIPPTAKMPNGGRSCRACGREKMQRRRAASG